MKHLLDTKVGPYQAMIPMVDVDTIGAGGGSIAYVDGGGIFRVGPRSAGADPGPGRLRPRRHRGDRDRRDGQPRLAAPRDVPRRRDVARRRRGPARVRGGPGRGARHDGRGGVDGRRPDPHALDGAVDRGELGAQGLRPARLRARRRGRRRPALRRADRARGRDAVGGRAALPGHRRRRWACSRPTWSTSTSATMYQRLSTLDAPGFQRAFEELEEQARDQLEEDGIAAEQIVIQRIADCRYLGQGYELRVDVDSGPIDHDWVEKIAARLPRHPRARVLAALRGVRHRDPEHPRARHRADAAADGRPRSSTASASPDAALRHEGEAWFRVDGELAAGRRPATTTARR